MPLIAPHLLPARVILIALNPLPAVGALNFVAVVSYCFFPCEHKN
jgi:hypothetical protein